MDPNLGAKGDLLPHRQPHALVELEALLALVVNDLVCNFCNFFSYDILELDN